jgi:hypothetical protein
MLGWETRPVIPNQNLRIPIPRDFHPVVEEGEGVKLFQVKVLRRERILKLSSRLL